MSYLATRKGFAGSVTFMRTGERVCERETVRLWSCGIGLLAQALGTAQGTHGITQAAPLAAGLVESVRVVSASKLAWRGPGVYVHLHCFGRGMYMRDGVCAAHRGVR